MLTAEQWLDELAADEADFVNQIYDDWVANVFCRTGPGGGVKPDCSPHGASASAPAAVGPEARAVLDKIKQSASVHEGVILGTLHKMFGADPTETRKKLLDAYDKAEVTINFPADLIGHDLSRDRHLRNLFESGTGRGETDTSVRKKFERTAFGKEADAVPDHDRPKYGAVNWEKSPDGAAPMYGDHVMVLNHHALKDRMTLAPEDSADVKMHQVAPASNPVNALARHAGALKAAGIDPSKGKEADGMRPMDLYGSYTEVQVWGKVPIDAEHIKEIRLYLNRHPGEHKLLDPMVKLAKEQGIPVTFFGPGVGSPWHEAQLK